MKLNERQSVSHVLWVGAQLKCCFRALFTHSTMKSKFSQIGSSELPFPSTLTPTVDLYWQYIVSGIWARSKSRKRVNLRYCGWFLEKNRFFASVFPAQKYSKLHCRIPDLSMKYPSTWSKVTSPKSLMFSFLVFDRKLKNSFRTSPLDELRGSVWQGFHYHSVAWILSFLSFICTIVRLRKLWLLH